MSRYIVLEHLRVQNANCIAGFTYGFPAITHFLGYTHALSRKLQPEFGIELTGCAVTCHKHQVQAYQPKGWGDYVFALTRNPLNKEGKTPPIVEEGRMHMTVSLIIECKGLIRKDQQNALMTAIEQFVQQHRLAGGQVINMRKATLYSDDDELALSRTILRKSLPGFILSDRSELLKQHFDSLKEQSLDATMLDAWLDFSALKYQAAVPAEEAELETTERPEAEWQRLAKPSNGYLVPIMTGYKAISPVYPAGTVNNARDPNSPFCFVECAYGVGQWLSPHRVQNIQDVLWRYQQQGEWYVGQTEAVDHALSLHPEQESLLTEVEETPITY